MFTKFIERKRRVDVLRLCPVVFSLTGYGILTPFS